MKQCMLILGLGLLAISSAVSRAGEAPPALPVAETGKALAANTWYEAKPELKFPENLKDPEWATGDGFSTNVYRVKTGTILVRTGIGSKDAGLSPGYYSNATVEWDLSANRGQAIDVFNYGGGSYGNGRLLPAFKDHPTPAPRHTYDAFTYVESEDAVYFMGGISYRMFTTKEFEQAAKDMVAICEKSLWKFSCADRRWTRVGENVEHGKNHTSVENHMIYWPEANKILFAYHNGRCADFDLKTQKWSELYTPKGSGQMSLYEAWSTWDSKRQLWIFRHGARICAFDPRTKEYTMLPNMFDPPKDPQAPLNNSQSIAYISKYDVYLTSGPTGNDTWVYDPNTTQWSRIQGGNGKLPNWAYMKCDPKTDTIALNSNLRFFRFSYKPSK